MIYLFDNRDRLIDIIAEEDLIEWTYTVAINTFDEAEFELPINYKLDLVKEAVYFGFFGHNDEFKVFRIIEKSLRDERLIKGLDRAESDLRTVSIIKDRRLQNVTADQALHVALEGTGYEVGEVDSLPMLGKTNFYYISPREALVKIIETWNCEFRVRYTFVENRIFSRYIDLFKREGKATGRQFYHGDDLLSIEHEESSDDVVTALIGRGKGEAVTGEDGLETGGYGRRIEFADVTWRKSAGKPVDKPAGQNYVLSEPAREKFGLYQNGQLKHRWGVFIDEQIEDKEVLLQRTWEELQKLSIPITTYRASLVEISPDIWKGDSVAIIHDDIGIAFEARIHKLVIDKLNNDRSIVELGDYATLRERYSTGRAIQQQIHEALDEQSLGLQAFLIRLEEEKARKNAEIDEKFRLAQLEMDNAIQGVKNEAEKGRMELAQGIEEMMTSQQAEFSRNYSDFTKTIQTRIGELTKTDALMQATLNQLAGEVGKQTSAQTELTTRLNSIEETNGGTIETIQQLTAKVDESTNAVQLISREQAQIKKSVDAISASVSSLDLDGVVRTSDVLIENGRVQIGAGKVIDGNTVSSLLTVQPEAIRAITNKMVITSRQTNLVNEKYRNICTRVSKSEYVMDAPLAIDEREFLITGEAMRVAGNGSMHFYCVVFYSDGSRVGTGYTASITNGSKSSFILTSKFTTTSGKTVSGIRFYMNISSSDMWELCNLSITPKMGAELIVDGSITADKLNVNNVRAGILTANSITSNMIQANAITADKLKVDTALINKLTATDALISSLVAKRAFITAVQAVDLSATRIKGGVLSALNGATTFNLNTGALDFYTSSPALRRVLSGYPTQFVRSDTGNVDGKGRAGVTVIGSNRYGSESSNDGGFAGVRIWNGNPNGQTVDSIDLVGDTINLTSAAYENQIGWAVSTFGKLQIYPIRERDRRDSAIGVGDIWLYLEPSGRSYSSLHELLKKLANSVGALYDYRSAKGEGHPAWWDIRNVVGRM
ncbi:MULTISPECIES: phage tail spike protein [unclassified Streptococcus]|uniref:phage tail spike protein n=1 Tax=unclassified Streptococcus TaxID=2608887 RepID=UPI00211ACFD9|nr:MULTISPECIES: phage tail spike protein [unclassified Streptococcus]MCQ9211812.1 phage tail protein [Streptococcus sp. B01]MCQ9212932.1 phage tail protein [Streptococcus sp. O1]